MKMKSVVRLASVVLVDSLLAAAPALAQDPVELAPGIYTVLFENDQVRVSDIRFKPGDKIAAHSHPDHLLYILSPGTIQLSYAGGTAKSVNAETGQVLWSEAESHSSENTGATEVHALIVELKQESQQPEPEPSEL